VTTLDQLLNDLIAPGHGGFSPELARYVLTLHFSPEQAGRYEALAQRNQDGAITPQEREELDAFVTANSLLMILKSKARRSLVEQPSAA
jgi:hypothetical protein